MDVEPTTSHVFQVELEPHKILRALPAIENPLPEIRSLYLVKQIQRVPPHFKIKNTHRDVYDPIIVSLGPYHHGKPQYSHAEIFKQVCVDYFVSGGRGDKPFYHGKILERIESIRGSYEEVDFDDQALAWLMLSDACFLLQFVYTFTSSRGEALRPFYDHFGFGRVNYIYRDIFLLENQIPIWIIKVLLDLSGNESLWNPMLLKLLKLMVSGDANRNLDTSPPEYQRSYHILEAFQCLAKVPVKIYPEQKSTHETENKVVRGCQFRSLTNLRKKGIRFKLSNQFSFTSNPLYGQLELPRFLVSVFDFEFNSNLIAYEMSSSNIVKNDLYMTSFINLMKTLIDTPNDVNILREEGILYSDTTSDAEILRMLKNLDTFGIENNSIFAELKESIERHCSSKARTWMAELTNTYFNSPWTIIALFAAFCALFLTFLQTYFTINPK